MKKIQNEDNLRTVVYGRTNGVQISELLKKRRSLHVILMPRGNSPGQTVIQKSTHSKLEALLF